MSARPANIRWYAPPPKKVPGAAAGAGLSVHGPDGPHSLGFLGRTCAHGPQPTADIPAFVTLQYLPLTVCIAALLTSGRRCKPMK